MAVLGTVKVRKLLPGVILNTGEDQEVSEEFLRIACNLHMQGCCLLSSLSDVLSASDICNQ